MKKSFTSVLTTIVLAITAGAETLTFNESVFFNTWDGTKWTGGPSGAGPQSFDVTQDGITFRLTIDAMTNSVPVNLGNSVFAQSLGVATGIKGWEFDQGSYALNPADDNQLSFSLDVVSGADILESISFEGINLRLFGTADKVAFSDHLGNAVTNNGTGTAAGANSNVLVSNLTALTSLSTNNLGNWTLKATALDSDATDGTETTATATRANVNSLLFNYSFRANPQPPVANDDSYATTPGLALTNAAPGLLTNDTDINNDAITAVLATPPANGTLQSFSSDGAFIYQPDPGFVGTDSFTYRANDGTFTSEVATVTILVDNDLTVANIFNDHMILQRNIAVPVRGTGNPGEEIEVSFAGQTNSVETDASGNWTAWLNPMPASTNPATLNIDTPRGTFAFTNLLVGDVWVCSGQSNMDRPMNADNPDLVNETAEIAAANYPLIRLMNIPLLHAELPQDDLAAQATWEPCSSSSAADFSATGYFFGRKVHLDSGVPLGLIESAVGGTRIERWMPEDLRTEIGYTYDDRITQLYNGMIHPLTGFPIKGAIWYQGESNGYDDDGQLALYKEKLESMILGWRDAWGVGEFPFYFAQIAPHTRGTNIQKLPILWDAFTRTLSVPNTEMISLNDLSEPGDITEVHPANKQDVGLRFGLVALEKEYGGTTNTAWSSPLFDSAVLTGSVVRVYFDPDTLGSGLASRDGLSLNSFELAGADEVYHTNATATIDGSTVLVSHPSVPAPAFVRFGWNGNVPHNFMNIEGLPVDTFSKAVTAQSLPVAHPDVYSTPAGTALLLDVLANDTDIENDSLTATVVSNAPNGTLTATNGMFLYTPDAGFYGTDRFTYSANDGTDDSQTVMVSVVVGQPDYPAVVIPNVFGSHMVLQRGLPIPFWGWGPVGQTVSVSLGSGAPLQAVVGADSTWEVELPAMTATNGPLTLVAAVPGSSVTLTNLAIGDVWLACGQSNMGWKLQHTDGGPEEAATANYPLFRFIKTPIIGKDTPQDNIEPLTPGDGTAEWRICSPDSAGDISAIGYYFARDVQTNLNIPIGLIWSAYAGTSVEAWSKSDVPNAQSDNDLFVPSHQLYNAMLNPYTKMPIKGAIWRQGDSNRNDGFSYAEKVRTMVTEWRSLWNVGDFPFYYAQNPTVFTYPEDPAIPLFWEGQSEIEKVLQESHMVIIRDVSDGSNVHPRNKAPAGIRLAASALKHSYGFDRVVSGPRMKSVSFEGDQVRVLFDHTGSGLAVHPAPITNMWDSYTGEVMDTDLSELTWFELCNAAGEFVPAHAVIDGNTVVVSAPSVSAPAGIRFAWSKYGIHNLMNAEGLPADSFRVVPPLALADQYGLHMNGELYVEPAGILANDTEGSSRLPIQRPILGNHPANGTLMLRDDGALIYEPNTGFTGIDTFTYAVTDGEETSPETTVEITVLSPGEGTGQINREVWRGISGYSISDLTSSPNYPALPDETGFISRLDAPRDVGDNYGQRIFGYLHPPTNGNYTFWVASSARSEFWLSTDESPANLTKRCSSWDRQTPEDWTGHAVQQSAPVALTGGQKYYFELLHKESAGTDHASVAWDLDGPGTTNIIEGTYLSGFPIAAPDTSNYAGWSSWYGVSGTDYLLDFAFNRNPGETGPEGLPAWSLDKTNGLSVEYQRRKPPTDITYAVQFTDNLLSNWVDSDAAESIAPINSTWEYVVVEDEIDTVDATNRFGRVMVTHE
jgi:sialate O-acetylesterase